MTIDVETIRYESGEQAGKLTASTAGLYAALVSLAAMLATGTTATPYARGYLNGIIAACKETAMVRT
jgi:hypothetical protein